MAGYIFNLDNLSSLRQYCENGVYSTFITSPDGYWKKHHEGTFADYALMKNGDNVYFFINRKIYGIGELTNVSGECKFNNFPGSSNPENIGYGVVRNQLLWDEGEWTVKNGKQYTQRWICTFKPSPYIFINGVDMDDALESNPNKFKMLRAFWKLSFIRFDDDENQAFKDILLKKNYLALEDPQHGINIYEDRHEQVHASINNKIQNGNYLLDIDPILTSCSNGNILQHEMAIEAGILYQLAHNDDETKNVLGAWDYISHQVIASPFKPIDYMDKMDLFGYSYIKNYAPTKYNFLVGEIKKDGAITQDIEQILKYVDWVTNEYCYGDYGMINAILIAYTFNDDVLNYAKEVGNRMYTIGHRPAKSMKWNDLKLIKYKFNIDNHKITFQEISA